VLGLGMLGACSEADPAGLDDAGRSGPDRPVLGDAADAAPPDSGDAGFDGGPDAQDGGDAGPSCADDGPLVLSFVEAAPSGYSANCMPVVAPDPARLELDFLRLENPGPAVTGLEVTRVVVRSKATDRTLQEIVLDPFVPFPERLDRGETWSSLVTKTSGSREAEAICGACGDPVELKMTFESPDTGCFRERVDIGDLACAF